MKRAIRSSSVSALRDASGSAGSGRGFGLAAGRRAMAEGGFPTGWVVAKLAVPGASASAMGSARGLFTAFVCSIAGEDSATRGTDGISVAGEIGKEINNSSSISASLSIEEGTNSSRSISSM